MNDKPRFHIRQAGWPRDEAAIRAVRSQVFIAEQGVPEDLEWDGTDAQALHLLVETPHGDAVGTARLFDDGRLGRMAVLPAYRGRGIGTALMLEALGLASERGVARVFLHAQVGVVPFYRRFGFEPVGDAFEEAGIPHQSMQLAVQ